MLLGAQHALTPRPPLPLTAGEGEFEEADRYARVNSILRLIITGTEPNGQMTTAHAVVKDMQQNGETIPEAIATRRYSGRFMVRIPPEQHRRLALEAAEAGVSLNRLASARLSSDCR
jgi:hypothetical protein